MGDGCLRQRQVQVGGVDQATFAQGECTFQDIFQFAHVAGKRVVRERFQRDGAQVRCGDASLRAQPLQDVFGQQWNILRAFAQAGHVQLDDVDAVEQILTELAFFHQCA